MDGRAVVDLHVHAGPDITHRRFTIREIAEVYAQVDGWVVVKSHLGSTASPAYQARQEGLPVSGSVVLNEFGGGVTPRAVELAVLEHGADPPARLLVYLPTLLREPEIDPGRTFHPGLARRRWTGAQAFDADGEILSHTVDVLKAVRDSGSVLASGHLGRDDSLRLIEAAIDVGVDRVLLTHALHPMSGFGLQDLLDLAHLDFVWVETTLLSLFLSRVDERDARALLSSFPRSVLSSDLGQPDQRHPTSGWEWARTWLSDDELLADVAVRSPSSLLRT